MIIDSNLVKIFHGTNTESVIEVKENVVTETEALAINIFACIMNHTSALYPATTLSHPLNSIFLLLPLMLHVACVSIYIAPILQKQVKKCGKVANITHVKDKKYRQREKFNIHDLKIELHLFHCTDQKQDTFQECTWEINIHMYEKFRWSYLNSDDWSLEHAKKLG